MILQIPEPACEILHWKEKEKTKTVDKFIIAQMVLSGYFFSPNAGNLLRKTKIFRFEVKTNVKTMTMLILNSRQPKGRYDTSYFEYFYYMTV